VRAPSFQLTDTGIARPNTQAVDFIGITVGKFNNPITNRGNDSSTLQGLESAAGWRYPAFLRRALPTAVRDWLRELRWRIMTPYLTRHLPRNKEFEQLPEDSLASAPLSIIVPVHDAPEVNRRCLMSLEKYAPKAEIVLVDDASELEETHKLVEDFSSRDGWKLIRHREPLRHSLACGAGAAQATRPYLCLLNSDTVVTPWCWRPIVQAFENNPEIGVAGPSTSSAKTQQALPLADFARHYLNDSQICAFASQLSAECAGLILTDLPWVSGFAFLIRRSLWEQLGGFDRNLPDYGNEIELCRRISATGCRVVWVRNSYIHHLGGASYSKAIGEASVWAHIQAAEAYVKQKGS
jgi:GT2 family glycosyltransferase